MCWLDFLKPYRSRGAGTKFPTSIGLGGEDEAWVERGGDGGANSFLGSSFTTGDNDDGPVGSAGGDKGSSGSDGDLCISLP